MVIDLFLSRDRLFLFSSVLQAPQRRQRLRIEGHLKYRDPHPIPPSNGKRERVSEYAHAAKDDMPRCRMCREIRRFRGSRK